MVLSLLCGKKIQKKFSRRQVITGLAAGTASIAGGTLANAQERLRATRQHRYLSEWRAGFGRVDEILAEIRTPDPLLSPQTKQAVEHAVDYFQRVLDQGDWPRVPLVRNFRLGARGSHVEALRVRLILSLDLDERAGVSSFFDAHVDRAVRKFQLRHGLKPDGVVGGATLASMNSPVGLRLQQLETNLVRLRSLSGYLGSRYVMVNIPAAEIEAVQDGLIYSRHTAVVGQADRATPILNSRIHEINFNPHWTVPVSIIRKDLIPRMQEDPEYLERNNIRIFSGRREIFTSDIDWYTDEAARFTFRQDPGTENSLGQVRINFHNKHAVFLHDTPSKNLFGRDFRFLSSGCVRVQNVRNFVAWLLQEEPGWDLDRINEVYRSSEAIDVPIKKPVPLYMTYVSAWASNNAVVNFRNDIYNLDGAEYVTASSEL